MISLEEHTILTSNYDLKHQCCDQICAITVVHVVAKGNITVTNPNNYAYYKKLAFKNNAPFTSCISKINNIVIDNAEDLDTVMRMYNLLEYSKNYRKTTGSLWNYY